MGIVLPLAAIMAFSLFSSGKKGPSPTTRALPPAKPTRRKSVNITAPAPSPAPARPKSPIADDIAAMLRSAVADADRDAVREASNPVAKYKPKPAPKAVAKTVPTPAAPPKPVPKPRAAPKPAPAPAPAPMPVAAPAPAPAGYDPDGARKMAASLSQHLTRAGRPGYDRRLLRTFQTKAGIKPDGIYGGSSRGALLFFGASNAPAPFFPPLETVPYRGPTS